MLSGVSNSLRYAATQAAGSTGYCDYNHDGQMVCEYRTVMWRLNSRTRVFCRRRWSPLSFEIPTNIPPTLYRIRACCKPNRRKAAPLIFQVRERLIGNRLFQRPRFPKLEVVSMSSTSQSSAPYIDIRYYRVEADVMLEVNVRELR